MLVWQGYCRIVRKISHVSAYIASAITIIMSLLIVTEIICRSFFGFSTLVADEYGSYFLCAATFFAGPLLMAEDGFLRVDIVYQRLKGIVKKICDTIIWSTALIFCGYMFYFCLHVVRSSLQLHAVSSYVSHTPLAYPQSIMLIGFAFLMLEIIVKLGEVFFPPVNMEIAEGDDNI